MRVIKVISNRLIKEPRRKWRLLLSCGHIAVATTPASFKKPKNIRECPECRDKSWF